LSPDPQPLWTYEDVEFYTGYSRRFMQSAVAAGTLLWTGSPAAKRFRKSDVDDWLESLKGDSSTPTVQKKRSRPRPYKPVYIKG
jgi:hypothetical protein